jgi:hypothetical protein
MRSSKAKAALVLSSTSLLLFLLVVALSGVKENVEKPFLVVLDEQPPSLSAAVAAAVTRQLRTRFAEEDKDLEEVCSKLYITPAHGFFFLGLCEVSEIWVALL